MRSIWLHVKNGLGGRYRTEASRPGTIVIVQISDEAGGTRGGSSGGGREQGGFWELLWVSIHMPFLGTYYV